MCVVCSINTSRDNLSNRSVLVDLFSALSVSILEVPDGKDLIAYFVNLMRKTANEIEVDSVVRRTLTNGLAGEEDKLVAKSRKVEVMLLGYDSRYYTDYGATMPEEIRGKVKRDIWDSLEVETAQTEELT